MPKSTLHDIIKSIMKKAERNWRTRRLWKNHMTKIYVIRHAEAEGNLYRIAQGQANSIITDRGWKQIAALERRFAEIHVDAVYASDLYRTCATASAIYRPKGLVLHPRTDLREICVGEWEQKTWGEISRTQPEQMRNFIRHLDRWQVAGGERPEQVRERMMGAIRSIAAENDGKTVAVFSHGCAIQILLATIEGYSIAELGKTKHGDNTAVSLIEAEGDTLRVVFRDDSTHLSDPRFTQGEPIKRRPSGLEPGLYFQHLQLPQQADFLTQCVGASWADMHEDRAWNPQVLLDEACQRPTLVGFLQEKAVGVVQFYPEKEKEKGHGWISLYCIEEPYRKHGFGIQLLGQAVSYFRPLGRETLCLALNHGNSGVRQYFLEYGFVPAGTTSAGWEILQKSIRYDPEFLTETAAKSDSQQVCC